ncbi:MAG: acyl-ACP--UDP-N-acetylglucosamine O-acyltransferase [Verrucomicrobiota bacterium]
MSSEIHETAIIHPDAEIGADCRIGPYCIIGEKVALGDGCYLHGHVVLDGNLTIGRKAEIFPFACLGKQTQDLKFKGEEGSITIGDDVTLREYVTVNMPTSGDGETTIGDNCHLLAYCHIAHDCRLGNQIVMSNSTHLAGHVIVEDRVVFGGMIGVHQFCRLGTMAMIGAHSKVVQDIVPYSLADGNPASPRSVNKVAMQRNDLDAETVKAVTSAHKTLFRSHLTQEQALAEINGENENIPAVNDIITFITNSERGIARPKTKNQSE